MSLQCTAIHFTNLNILFTVTTAFYLPATLLNIFPCFRHGFSPNTGFIFLIFFSLIWIIGAGLNLAFIYSPLMQVGILNTVALVLAFIGVLSLLLAALGLVYRVRFGMVKIYPTIIKLIHLILLRILVVVALALCDEGTIKYRERVRANGIFKIPITFKVGVVLFLIISIITIAVTGILFRICFFFDDLD